ncbi:MAG: hypothetical protein O7F16_10245 [Acidobacteria bacterium]|nr:hypothetical protein [Acidobacteriota bacterium]
MWLGLNLGDGGRVRSLGLLYWLPNPLLPFIGFRVGLPRVHPGLHIEQLGVLPPRS